MSDEPTSLIAQPPDPEIAVKAKLMDALYASPEHRPKLLKLVKEFAPHVRIPEIDTAASVAAEMKPLQDEIAQLKADARKREAAEAEAQARREVIESGLITAEELPAVEKIRDEKKIPDWKTAAEYHRMSQQVARPRAGAPQPIALLPNAPGLFSDPARWARQEAHRVLAEMGR